MNPSTQSKAPQSDQADGDIVNMEILQIPNAILEVLTRKLGLFGKELSTLNWTEKQRILQEWRARHPSLLDPATAASHSDLAVQENQVQRTQRNLGRNKRDIYSSAEGHGDLLGIEPLPLGSKRQRTSVEQTPSWVPTPYARQQQLQGTSKMQPLRVQPGVGVASEGMSGPPGMQESLGMRGQIQPSYMAGSSPSRALQDPLVYGVPYPGEVLLVKSGAQPPIGNGSTRVTLMQEPRTQHGVLQPGGRINAPPQMERITHIDSLRAGSPATPENAISPHQSMHKQHNLHENTMPVNAALHMLGGLPPINGVSPQFDPGPGPQLGPNIRIPPHPCVVPESYAAQDGRLPDGSPLHQQVPNLAPSRYPPIPQNPSLSQGTLGRGTWFGLSPMPGFIMGSMHAPTAMGGMTGMNQPVCLDQFPPTVGVTSVDTGGSNTGAADGPGMAGLEDLWSGLFAPEFTQDVASTLDDFDLDLLGVDGDVVFERDFGQWFPAPVEEDHCDEVADTLLDELFQALTVEALVTAELHSAERWPQPRCHPGTRVDLTKRIHNWLTDENREQDILWLSGPAGVGKSAIAQTIGELAEELGIFGAAIFFSSGRKVDNSSLFVTSIASQLTVQDDTYRKLVADLLRGDPAVLRILDKQAQLKKLLTKPFSTLQNSPKRLIVIDGLDECRGDAKQLHLVKLIAETVTAPDSPPFLWMVCSRPEHHLKELFRSDILSKICLQLDLLPQESGAQADIERYLIDGLERIAQRYGSWHNSDSTLRVVKNSEELNKLVHAARGVFVVASSILGFVGDPAIANPPAQLRIVLNAIDGSSTDSDGGNFLAPIDALYVGVLARLRRSQRQKTLQLLGICAISPQIPALHLANLLGITRVAFYSALRSLHAFLSVPHHTAASQETLHFFHASFPDFLGHRSRSKDYFQDPDIHRFRMVKAFFRALNSTSFAYSQGLSWLPSEVDQDEIDVAPNESPLSVAYDMLNFAATHTWELCTRISSLRDQGLLFEMVASFDFRRLRLFSDVIPVRLFVEFFRWLYALGKEIPELAYIVRTDCRFDEDKKMLERCGPISQPLNLESAAETDELEKSPRYIFVGFSVEIIVALLVPEAVIIYSIEDIGNL